ASAPRLIRKLPGIDADRPIKIRKKRARKRRKKHRGALVCDEALAIYHEFIAPRLAAENGVIFKCKTGAPRTRLAIEKQGRCEAANSAAYHHTVKLLAGIL